MPMGFKRHSSFSWQWGRSLPVQEPTLHNIADGFEEVGKKVLKEAMCYALPDGSIDNPELIPSFSSNREASETSRTPSASQEKPHRVRQKIIELPTKPHTQCAARGSRTPSVPQEEENRRWRNEVNPQGTFKRRGTADG